MNTPASTNTAAMCSPCYLSRLGTLRFDAASILGWLLRPRRHGDG